MELRPRAPPPAGTGPGDAGPPSARSAAAALAAETRADTATFLSGFDEVTPDDLTIGSRYALYRKKDRRKESNDRYAVKLIATYAGGHVTQNGKTYYKFVAVRPPYEIASAGRVFPNPKVALIPAEYGKMFYKELSFPAFPPLTDTYSAVYAKSKNMTSSNLAGQYRMSEKEWPNARKELVSWAARPIYFSADDWYFGQTKSEGKTAFSIPPDKLNDVDVLKRIAAFAGDLTPPKGGKKRRGGTAEELTPEEMDKIDETNRMLEKGLNALPENDSAGGRRRRTSRRKSKSRRTIRRRTFS